MSEIRCDLRKLRVHAVYWFQTTWAEIGALWDIHGPYLLSSSFLLILSWLLIPFIPSASHVLPSTFFVSAQTASVGAFVSAVFGFFMAGWKQHRRFFVGACLVYFWWLFLAVLFFGAGQVFVGAVCAGGAFLAGWDGYQWMKNKIAMWPLTS